MTTSQPLSVNTLELAAAGGALVNAANSYAATDGRGQAVAPGRDRAAESDDRINL